MDPGVIQKNGPEGSIRRKVLRPANTSGYPSAMSNPNLTTLRAHIKRLPDIAARERFALACGTTLNYLRKVLSRKHFVPDAALCVAIERESGGAVRCEDLRPDVDWRFLRRTDCPVPALEQAA